MTPRFRYAPSPTGTPHIGNLHTALFSWALARAMRGDFIIRIDDTDPERNTAGAIQAMLEALTWLGLDWDEGPDVGGDYGPYIQSQRLSFHRQAMRELVAGGFAYYGDDPDHPAGPDDGQPLRLRLPKSGQTVIHDALRGPITFDNEKLRDTILVRSDGRPLYHLASVVDDHQMGITHVVRGDDWISTSYIHVHLYRALGWPEPVWVHLPLILNKRGEKLKKRDPEGGYLITDFQAAGYLPEALFNYLLLLGWAPDNAQEIINQGEVLRQIRLGRLSVSPSIFDWDKLNWVSRQYLQRRSDGEMAQLVRPFLEEAYGPLPGNEAWLIRLTAVVRDGFDKLADAVKLSGWAFVDDFDYTEAATHDLNGEAAGVVLPHLVAALTNVVLLDAQTAQALLQELRGRFKQSHNYNARTILHPIRAALIGDVSGPPLHEIMGILGKERVLERVARVLKDVKRET